MIIQTSGHNGSVEWNDFEFDDDPSCLREIKERFGIEEKALDMMWTLRPGLILNVAHRRGGFTDGYVFVNDSVMLSGESFEEYVASVKRSIRNGGMVVKREFMDYEGKRGILMRGWCFDGE